MQQEVICDSFQVIFRDGTVRQFMKTETSEFQWSLTPSGDLLIYYKEYHKKFTMAAIKDQRIAAFGSGVWAEVEILPEEEKEEDDSGKEDDADTVLHEV